MSSNRNAKRAQLRIYVYVHNNFMSNLAKFSPLPTPLMWLQFGGKSGSKEYYCWLLKVVQDEAGNTRELVKKKMPGGPRDMFDDEIIGFNFFVRLHHPSQKQLSLHSGCLWPQGISRIVAGIYKRFLKSKSSQYDKNTATSCFVNLTVFALFL